MSNTLNNYVCVLSSNNYQDVFTVFSLPHLTTYLVCFDCYMLRCSATSADQSKVVATLTGDSISHADISLRLPKHSQPSQRTIVQNDAQWKLQVGVIFSTDNQFSLAMLCLFTCLNTICTTFPQN